MKKFISESLKTPERYKCDVCVAGGGIAGISAALAAARQGAEVILLDRGFMLGGLATAGLVTIYLPICDGLGNQVSFGIAEELLRLSIKLGYDADHGYPAAWLEGGGKEERCRMRYEVRYNAQLFAILAERLLLDAGVKILYGAHACGCEERDGKITYIIIEGKSGREAIKARSVVDATGDCDIARLAGAETREFGGGNLLAAWYYSYSEGAGKYGLNMHGFCDISDEEKAKGNKVDMLTSRRFSGLDTEELSEQMILSHENTLAHIIKTRQEHPDTIPTTIATIPQIRMTRCLSGAYTMDDTEIRKEFPDSVGLFSDWRKRGPVYELPFRTLYCEKIKNLLCAGRCISVTDAMWDITRVIPVCAVSGEAAGIAASMSDDMTALDIGELQAKLKQGGVKLHAEQ